MLTNTPEARLNRARVSLEGLSVGDAFGGFFELTGALSHLIKERKLPPRPWHFTDDTNMALSIYAISRQYGEIDQDALVRSFMLHFDRMRGYGMGVRHLMVRMKAGENWRDVVVEMFRGGGSFGSGGAMRVAPLGAYFADDLDRVVEQARKSAEVTHAHEEGIAGAIAVAVAAAQAWRLRGQNPPSRREFIGSILPHVPESIVREKIRHARELAHGSSVTLAVSALGNGSRITAQDTVPFALW